MANLVTTKTNEISLKGSQDLVSSVKNGLKLVSQGYLAITPDVAKLYDCKGYKSLGYKNFDELCTMEFGMSHGTTVGIRKVFDKFGAISKDNKYTIPDKYLEYGYTKLLLFTDKKFAEYGIDPIKEFTPEMTMAEMKNALATAIEEKDKKAIDTTAKEVAEEVVGEVAEEVAEEVVGEVAEEVDEEKDLTPIDMIEEIQYLLSELRKVANVKPEKMALLDNMDAVIKEFKKALKK